MNRFISGDKVSKFVIEKLLGQGGFAEAYLATDTRLDRLVVIKCLRPDLGERLEGIKFALEEFQARFLVEARAQARVNHPNVCTLFEVEEENKILILEYIKGVTLEELCAAGPLSKTDLIGIVIAIGNAMVEAHAKDVLHRDLTLRNVMLAEGKQVKLLDFGLGAVQEQDHIVRRRSGSFAIPGGIGCRRAVIAGNQYGAQFES